MKGLLFVFSLNLFVLAFLAGCGEDKLFAPSDDDSKGKTGDGGDGIGDDDDTVNDGGGGGGGETGDDDDEAIFKCRNNRDCPSGYDCQEGVCVKGELPKQTDCSQAQECPETLPICDAKSGKCVACLVDSDCPPKTKCQDGYCLPEKTGGDDPTCQDKCDNEGEKGCSGNFIAVCKDGNDDGCLEWVEDSKCPEGTSCSNGACKNDCEDECPASGAKECSGNGYRECGQFDNDPCLEWGDVTPCEDVQYCEDGQCVDMICYPGTQECISKTSFRYCHTNGKVWVEDACLEGEVCDLGYCKPRVCNGGEMKCESEYVEMKCDASETFWSRKSCEGENVCIDGRCQAKVCQPNEITCKDTGTVMTCNDKGTSYTEKLCGGMEGCEDGECKPRICNPRTTECADIFNIKTCNLSGTAWIEEPCPPDKSACEVDQCKVQVCWADSVSCDGEKVMKCNQYGTALNHLKTCEYSNNGEKCINGDCVDLCKQVEIDRSYIGCEYWPIDLPNGGGFNAENAQYTVTAANPYSDLTAKVTVSTNGGVVASVDVPPRTLVPINLPARNTLNQSAVNYQTYHLKSTIPVTVHQFNPFTNNPMVYSNDASLLLPTQALDGVYYVLTSDNSFGTMSGNGDLNGFMVVVATEDNTSVTVRPTTATISGPGISALAAGQTHTLTLNRLQMLQLECNVKRCDLTGSKVTADKPVAVYAGVGCAQKPTGVTACDHLESQMFPLSTWGKNFVATRTKPRNNEPDFWRIIAGNDGTTTIQTDPPQPGSPFTLNPGQWKEFESKSDFIISADQPIMVGQFLSGQDYGAGTGDPAFMLLPPIEQYRKDYIVISTHNYAHDRINITAPQNADVTLDGAPITTGWTNIPNTHYRVVKLVVDDGIHMITATAPVGVMVYGFDRYVSYAYTGGLDLKRINDTTQP